MWKRILAGTGLVFLLTLFLFPAFSSISVCDQCACESSDTDLQLPLLRWTFWRFHTEHQTPLGELGVEFGFVEPHVHHWRFGIGGGDGSCALGIGREMRGNATSKDVINFIRITDRYRGRKEARAWFEAALDERRCGAVRHWQLFLAPLTEFTSKAHYEESRQRADRFGAKEWPELIGDGLIARPKP
jgi:hypothetical protein